MFYIKMPDLEGRTKMIAHLVKNEILAVFHYVPLHSAPAGKRFGTFFGEDEFTTRESNRLLRLPMFYGLKSDDLDFVCDKIQHFYE